MPNAAMFVCDQVATYFGVKRTPGEGGTPYSGLYGEAPPERGALFKLAVYERVGKTAILVVYETVTKSAAKWKKWWLKQIASKGATFWQK